MWQAISAAMARLEADDAVRVIILRGHGEMAFSAGADLAPPPAEPEAMASACFNSDDYREGRSAFREKRPPRFKGR